MLARGAVDESKAPAVIPVQICGLKAIWIRVHLMLEILLYFGLRLSAREFCRMTIMLRALGLSTSTPAGCFSCACTRIPSLIPVAFVQSLANLNFLNKRFPFLHPVIKIVSSALHTHLDDSSIFMLLSDAWTGKGIILEHQSTLLSQHVDRPVEYQTIFVTYFCVLFRHVHTLHTERKHKGVLNWATLV